MLDQFVQMQLAMTMLTIRQVKQSSWHDGLQCQCHNAACCSNSFCSRCPQIPKQTPQSKVPSRKLSQRIKRLILVGRVLSKVQFPMESPKLLSKVSLKENFLYCHLLKSFSGSNKYGAVSECNKILTMVGVRTQFDYEGELYWRMCPLSLACCTELQTRSIFLDKHSGKNWQLGINVESELLNK